MPTFGEASVTFSNNDLPWLEWHRHRPVWATQSGACELDYALCQEFGVQNPEMKSQWD